MDFSGPGVEKRFLCNHLYWLGIDQLVGFSGLREDERFLCNHFCRSSVKRSVCYEKVKGDERCPNMIIFVGLGAWH